MSALTNTSSRMKTLVFDWFMKRLVVKNMHTKNTWGWWHWTLCSKWRQHWLHNLLEDLHDPLKMINKNNHLDLYSYKFCIWTHVLTLGMTILVMHNWTSAENNSLSLPVAKNVYGVGSICYRHAYISTQGPYALLWNLRTLKWGA